MGDVTPAQERLKIVTNATARSPTRPTPMMAGTAGDPARTCDQDQRAEVRTRMPRPAVFWTVPRTVIASVSGRAPTQAGLRKAGLRVLMVPFYTETPGELESITAPGYRA